MDIQKIDTRKIGIELLVIPMFITGILVIFTNLPIGTIAGISFFLGIIIVVADFIISREKPEIIGAPTTQALKKTPWGTVIGVITVIVVIVVIASVVSNYDGPAEKVISKNSRNFVLVFEDKFNQEENRNWIVKSGNWAMENGELSGEKNQCAGMWVILEKKFPGDVILEFDAYTDENNPSAGIECTIGTDYNPDIGYTFAFGGNSNTKTSILRNNYFMDENKNELVKPGKIYHIKAQRIGGDISLFVDGKRVAHFYDPNPLNGRSYSTVGLKSVWGRPKVHFDNVRVYTNQ